MNRQGFSFVMKARLFVSSLDFSCQQHNRRAVCANPGRKLLKLPTQLPAQPVSSLRPNDPWS